MEYSIGAQNYLWYENNDKDISKVLAVTYMFKECFEHTEEKGIELLKIIKEELNK